MLTNAANASGSTAHAAAEAAFAPERFGLRRHRAGWLLDAPDHAPIAFVPLSWQHAQSASHDRVGDTNDPVDALVLISRLQGHTWGMPPEEVVPSNLLAVLPDTGGGVIVAYDLSIGCNIDGWLGFVIGAGSRSGVLVSHMLGVREELRGARDIGWRLKLLQAHEALRTGHHAMSWTFDPMRGPNARLNLEKLAASVEELTIDKYGALRSNLYGDVPSDRFIAAWDLYDPGVHSRIEAVAEGSYPPLTPRDLESVPILTAATHAELRRSAPERLRYRIPGDIDQLMRHDSGAAIHWRQELRASLTGILPTQRGHLDPHAAADGPIAMEILSEAGDYRITGFATSHDEHGERQNWYLLTRKERP